MQATGGTTYHGIGGGGEKPCLLCGWHKDSGAVP